MKNFKDLDVWKRSCSLSIAVYKAMVDCKDYGFRDQITRSSLSIASNIAEGVGRNSNKDTARFLDIALGSAAELETQIYIGIEIGYVPAKTGKEWLEQVTIIQPMLMNLKKYFAKSPKI